MIVKKKAKPAVTKKPASKKPAAKQAPPKKMSKADQAVAAKRNSEAIQGTAHTDLKGKAWTAGELKADKAKWKEAFGSMKDYALPRERQQVEVDRQASYKQESAQPSKRTAKLIEASSGDGLQLFTNYHRNYFLQIREAVKYDYFISLRSGKVEVLKLPKVEMRHLTAAKGKNDTPKHFAEVMLASTLEKADAARRILEAVLKNPGSIANMNVETTIEGDATESPLKETNSAKPINGENLVPLKKICADANIDPKIARRVLRGHGQKPAGRWEWPVASVPVIMSILQSAK